MYDDGSGIGLQGQKVVGQSEHLSRVQKQAQKAYTIPHGQLMRHIVGDNSKIFIWPLYWHHVLVMIWSENALVYRQANQSNKTTRTYYILENINVTVEEQWHTQGETGQKCSCPNLLPCLPVFGMPCN